MKKQKAIDLLQFQIDNINNPKINRKEWITTTTTVIQRVFPVSSGSKIKQIEGLDNSPGYFEDISIQDQIKTRKSKAERFLNNYIEEIDLLGMEGNGDIMGLFFGSIRFWIIIPAICILSFIGGSSIAITGETSSHLNPQLQDLERRLHHQKMENDSLKKELQVNRTLG